MKETQLPKSLIEIVDEEEQIFSSGTSITERSSIPDTSEIPIQNPNHWMKISEIVCVFVDMKNSTGLSAGAHPNTTAASYRLFTSTAVRFFHQYNAPYIDIKGDGVFALFNENQTHRALALAVAFKTFATSIFIKKVKEKTNVDVGLHIGIDAKAVLVRKIGLKIVDGRTDRQNEVWAGKPVNMAAKLASYSGSDEIIASNRFYNKLTDEKALKSCGCSNGKTNQEKIRLWESLDVSEDKRFDFNTAYVLKSCLCEIHGTEYFEHLVSLRS